MIINYIALARIDDEKAVKAVINSIRDLDDDTFNFELLPAISLDPGEDTLSPSLIKELIAILNDDSISARMRTILAYTLAEGEVDVSKASTRLIQIVKSSEKDYLRAAISYLLAKSGINDVVPDVIILYQRITEQLTEALTGDSTQDTEATWYFTLEAIGEYGPQASEAGPMLIRTLKNEAIPLGTREDIIEILGRIHYKGALEILNELKTQSGKEWDDEDIEIAIRRIQGRTIDELVQDLNDEKFYFQEYAVEELGELGKQASRAIPHLVNILRQEDRWIIWEQVAIALGKIGIPSQEVIEALERASRHFDEDIQNAALRALEKLRNEPPD